MGQIVLFTKDDCTHCVHAKEILGNLDVPITELDVENDLQNRITMTVASGRHTVPQIFFNNNHIGGATELKALNLDELKKQTTEALAEPEPPAFLSNQPSEEDLETALLPLTAILDPHLPGNLTEHPEVGPVFEFYGNFFGFIPNKFDYMVLKPDSMGLHMAVLITNVLNSTDFIGRHMWPLVAFTTAFSAQCTYCAAHSAERVKVGCDREKFDNLDSLAGYLQGNGKTLDDLPFTNKEKAIINLTQKATLGKANVDDIEKVCEEFGILEFRKTCYGVDGLLTLMGAGNIFNDIIGFEIESSVKELLESSNLASDWSWGVHDTEAETDKYDFKKEPEFDPSAFSIHDARDRVFELIAPLLEKYGAFSDVLLPTWIATRPSKHNMQAMSCLYHSIFNSGKVKSETKHLMAYGFARTKNADSLAAEEKRITIEISDDEKVIRSKLALIDKHSNNLDGTWVSQLDTREALVMRLAACASRFPAVARGAITRDLANEFNPEEIVELALALMVLGAGERSMNLHEPLMHWILNGRGN